MTTYIALIGYPLGHSISPLFQQAALDHYHLDTKYLAWEVAPEGLAGALERLRRPENLGANITIPYKEKALPSLDRLEGQVREIGAVNTIAKDKDALVGYNTDGPAFLKALREKGDLEPRGQDVVLLGAGGAARALAFSLLRAGIRSLTIYNRGLERARKLAGDLEEVLAPGQGVQALPWEERLSGLPPCQLIVQATPLGTTGENPQSPLPAQLIPRGVLAYDLVYNPPETPFLKEAKKAGARALGGLAMLVYQGAASFGLWTGREAPVDVMFHTAEKALKSSQGKV
ncbi:MAG: shikimate dehydrogenase [Chloroflexi bacterium]|nr:shikimate dehydrogenase [Chloroflexota bacterium]